MLVDERKAHLLQRINDTGKVSAGELAAEFGTSEDTIRRDLRALSAAGLCRRVYGGALRLSPAFGTSLVRAKQSVASKAILGARLAQLVEPGQLVFIDAGSTNLAAARSLPSDLNATIVTHDPVIAAAVAAREGLELIVIGGRVDPAVGAALGVEAARTIGLMRPDLLLLGACALDAEFGVAAFHAEDATMKRLLIERAGSVAAAIVSEKLGTWAPFSIGAASVIRDLVVEQDASSPILDDLVSLGIHIHRCAVPTDAG
jgi:DeoR/GlpR family transcriptional regulator of sugar metabolism